ncbi:MAG: hypothetical protein NDF54_07220 [archaeon GB-1867-035]|nr:hypothetical protein [Candidatus Culexmicrobium profundum]
MPVKIDKAVRRTLDLRGELDEIVDMTLASKNQLSMIAEGGGYAALLSTSATFRSLLGANVGCYFPREYMIYAAPYASENEVVFIFTRRSPIPPRIIDVIKTCGLMRLKTILVVLNKISEEDEELLDYVEFLIEIEVEDDKLALNHFMAENTFLTLIAIEAALKSENRERARNILEELSEISFEEDKSIRNILRNCIQSRRSIIFSGPPLYGLALKICRDLNVNSNSNITLYKTGEHPHVTRTISEKDYVIIMKTELEDKSAREISNFLKIRGLNSEIIEYKGDPLIATIEMGGKILPQLYEIMPKITNEDVW